MIEWCGYHMMFSHEVCLTDSTLCLLYDTGESSCEVKTEADSSDHTEHSHHDKRRPYLSTVDCEQFTTARNWASHSSLQIVQNCHSCSQCDKRF